MGLFWKGENLSYNRRNTVDADETDHNKSPHPNLCCLLINLFSFLILLKLTHFYLSMSSCISADDISCTKPVHTAIQDGFSQLTTTLSWTFIPILDNGVFLDEYINHVICKGDLTLMTNSDENMLPNSSVQSDQFSLFTVQIP